MPGPYTEAHRHPNGPGDLRPTALQIIHDEGLKGKWQDKIIVITGCSSGIGIETARALATTGAKLFVTARDVEKGEQALADILSDRVQLIQMDQMSLESVRKGSQTILENSGGKVNILICNAGVMRLPERKLSTDGFEAQFATNHLAHFLLFNLLKDALLAASTPEFNSRVILLSSSGHTWGGVRFEDYNWEHDYDPSLAYGSSKTANLYMSNYIDRVFGPRGIHSTSLDPGGIFTGLQIHVPEDVMTGWKRDPNVQVVMKSPEQGASTTVYAATSKDWEGKGGRYLQDCEEAPPVSEGYSFISGYAPHAYEKDAEDRLWNDSLAMLNL
ncbi:putative ww domain-containing oxidoreductase [Phaeomoniella chlamydospora]|uniref:Putative ww domain-containing oxidoreductase n=1 Tax=Phaeomoniella chlamydospora TaxID=158046 RepID=A0A0G2EZZ9_PHACM|nr:putative ww domain-containing oxidoreductase [Phaeomoniella chlamydospora]